jgi:hypothetical protein
MNKEELVRFAKDVHRVSTEKGWWDKSKCDTSFTIKQVLIISELSEAIEEYRKKDFDPKLVYWDDGTNHRRPWDTWDERTSNALGGRMPKPEGYPVELADAGIRILDTIMQFCEAPEGVISLFDLAPVKDDVVHDIPSHVLFLMMNISLASQGHSHHLTVAFEHLVEHCQVIGIDLLAEMQRKHTYNQTRSIRHGDKRA